ncbi:hypothetical protein GPECTOR_82g262 [Gonium pectorale]|uniref:phytol kinase n=1 Tax=Gonium pectorale TaxID=33097 RepID=A0A150G1L7_GONPE|nr:hypothetical protein GPECTOR_82g262 [Gonium pectorale]|eukprot:KXZ43728.1 hypothetical protein GPECTOR_82g262 [Gonium pectorale]
MSTQQQQQLSRTQPPPREGFVVSPITGHYIPAHLTVQPEDISLAAQSDPARQPGANPLRVVAAVLDERLRSSGGTAYLVKWKGYELDPGHPDPVLRRPGHWRPSASDGGATAAVSRELRALTHPFDILSCLVEDLLNLAWGGLSARICMALIWGEALQAYARLLAARPPGKLLAVTRGSSLRTAAGCGIVTGLPSVSVGDSDIPPFRDFVAALSASQLPEHAAQAMAEAEAEPELTADDDAPGMSAMSQSRHNLQCLLYNLAQLGYARIAAEGGASERASAVRRKLQELLSEVRTLLRGPCLQYWLCRHLLASLLRLTGGVGRHYGLPEAGRLLGTRGRAVGAMGDPAEALRRHLETAADVWCLVLAPASPGDRGSWACDELLPESVTRPGLTAGAGLATDVAAPPPPPRPLGMPYRAGAAAAGGAPPGLQHLGLRCALDGGFVPAVERLLRRTAPASGAVHTALYAVNRLLRASGVWPAILAHGSAREVASLITTLAKLPGALSAARLQEVYLAGDPHSCGRPPSPGVYPRALAAAYLAALLEQTLAAALCHDQFIVACRCMQAAALQGLAAATRGSSGEAAAGLRARDDWARTLRCFRGFPIGHMQLVVIIKVAAGLAKESHRRMLPAALDALEAQLALQSSDPSLATEVWLDLGPL